MATVLVLDDNTAVLRVVSQQLAAVGADVYACREIEAAEALLEHRRFDAVVCDLNVSERGGLEGMRLIRHVSARFPDARVVGISGMADDGIHDLGRAMGAVAILQKPIDFPVLRRHVFKEAPKQAEGKIHDVELLEAAMTGLRAALQPICRLAASAGRTSAIGVEALVRLSRPSVLGSPPVLFEYALRKDRVFELDRRCMGAALAEAALLDASRLLFLNAHPRSLTNPAFAGAAVEMARQAVLQPQSIVFEVTEQQTIGDPAAFSATLADLRAAGFKVALDDFGSGFANMELLNELRPDYVKMSGVLVRSVESDRSRQIIVGVIVTLAERLGIPLIAENVETEEQLRVLRELGVPYAQGYYFARPAAATDIRRAPIDFKP